MSTGVTTTRAVEDAILDRVDRARLWERVLQYAFSDSGLTDRELSAFIMFAAGHNTADIGRSLGVSRERGTQLMKSALMKCAAHALGVSVSKKDLNLSVLIGFTETEGKDRDHDAE